MQMVHAVKAVRFIHHVNKSAVEFLSGVACICHEYPYICKLIDVDSIGQRNSCSAIWILLVLYLP